MAADHFNTIIIGGGPAGMSALLWARSLNLRAILLEQAPELGGQMLQMFHRVYDYPGLIGLTGGEMRDRFVDHLSELKLQWRTGCRIDAIDLSSLRVRSDDQTLSAGSIVIATGAGKRKLGIPGEDRLAMRGVSFSATRDHSQYAGKRVCVIGGGDSAVENSLTLARICPQVTLIHRSDRFRARRDWLREARHTPQISIVSFAEALAIEGDQSVERLILRDLRTGARREIETEGVFIKVGITPNTQAFRDQLDLDQNGYIKVDQSQRTSIDMVYAAGDVCRPVCLSVSTAVGHGAVAVKDIAERINRQD